MPGECACMPRERALVVVVVVGEQNIRPQAKQQQRPLHWDPRLLPPPGAGTCPARCSSDK